jgi:hypothetical protein
MNGVSKFLPNSVQKGSEFHIINWSLSKQLLSIRISMTVQKVAFERGVSKLPDDCFSFTVLPQPG